MIISLNKSKHPIASTTVNVETIELTCIRETSSHTAAKQEQHKYQPWYYNQIQPSHLENNNDKL